jgi:hypothetical protein
VFPGVVNVEQESLEDEKIDGVPSISLPDRKEQAGRSGKDWVRFETAGKDWDTDEIRKVSIPIMAGNLSKLRPKRAMV